ncbi:MAG TPA: hypothetical protein VFT22_11415, partial [Kofleriaceae bacterium]|nr:hypothetical protein [Kofleriaceae bacterium]
MIGSVRAARSESGSERELDARASLSSALLAEVRSQWKTSITSDQLSLAGRPALRDRDRRICAQPVGPGGRRAARAQTTQARAIRRRRALAPMPDPTRAKHAAHAQLHRPA